MSYHAEGQGFSLLAEPTFDPADIGIALGAAVDRVQLAQGGTVFIPPSRINFSTLVTKVDKNMGTNNAPAYVHIKGFGTAIRLALAVPADHAIILQAIGVGHVHFSDLCMSGNPAGGGAADCATALSAQAGAIDVSVSRCQFYGILSTSAQQGIVNIAGRNVDISNCGFHGCAATGAQSAAISLFMDTQRVDSCFFETQATFKGTTYNKTGGRGSILVRAQAGVLDPNIPGGAPNAPVGSTQISRCYFEDNTVTEGIVICRPRDEPGIDHVEVQGCVFIVPSPLAGAGLLTETGVSGLGTGFGTNLLISRDCAFQGASELAPRLADLQNLGLFIVERATLHGANPPMVTKVRDLVTEIHMKDWLFDRPALDTFSNFPTRAFYTQDGLQTEFPANVGPVVGWWTADAGITLNGSNVASWASQNAASDVTKTVVQGAAGLQPLYTRRDAQYNDLPTLSFAAATGHFLSSGAFAAALVQPLTWYIVGHCNDTAAEKCFFDGNTVVARNQFNALAAGETTQWYCGAAILGVAALTSPFVGCAIAAGAAGAVYINNSQVADAGPGAVGGQGIAGISIGVAFDGTSTPLDGKIAEIIVFQGVHDAIQRARVFAYLGQKYGIATI